MPDDFAIDEARDLPAQNEDDGRQSVHGFSRQPICKFVSEVSGWHVGKHHAQCCPGNHTEDFVETRGQCDRHDLRFVSHLREKKRHYGGAKHAQLALGRDGIRIVELVGNEIARHMLRTPCRR